MSGLVGRRRSTLVLEEARSHGAPSGLKDEVLEHSPRSCHSPKNARSCSVALSLRRWLSLLGDCIDPAGLPQKGGPPLCAKATSAPPCELYQSWRGVRGGRRGSTAKSERCEIGGRLSSSKLKPWTHAVFRHGFIHTARRAAREKMSIPKLFIGTAETGACTFQNQLSLARGTRTRAGSASPWSHGQESANQMVAHRPRDYVNPAVPELSTYTHSQVQAPKLLACGEQELIGSTRTFDEFLQNMR